MSLEATKAVWERSKARGTDKLVLLAIADCADRHGIAFPRTDSLAEKTGLDVRSIRRIRRSLICAGEIEEIASDKKRRSRTYKISAVKPDKLSASWSELADVHDREERTPVTAETVTDDRTSGRQCPQERTPVTGAIRNEQSLNSHGTVSERGIQNPSPPVMADFSDHDAAAQQGMILFNVRGNSWRKMFLDCIPASIRAGVEVLDSAEHMHAAYTRYRARGGLKSDWFFLADLYGKPESEWGLDGVNQSSRNQTKGQQRAASWDRALGIRRDMDA